MPRSLIQPSLEPLTWRSAEFTLNTMSYRAARIAKGAAYATLTRMSVERFAEKCAFVLQKGRVIRRGEDDEHVEYEDSAETIWYQEVC